MTLGREPDLELPDRAVFDADATALDEASESETPN